MLVGLVVAGAADEATEARRAVGQLEMVGRQFQNEWTKEGGDDSEAPRAT
jgi:hypothetical protein